MYYTKWLKRRNKIELITFVISVLIVVSTILYSQYLARQISDREELQMSLWAKSIQDNAKLIKLSNEIFNNLSNEERIKISLYSTASKLIVSETDEKMISFLFDIIRLNENIPTVSTDSNFRVIDYRNIDDKSIIIGNILDSNTHQEFWSYKPIIIRTNQNLQYIFYKDSRIFDKLKKYLESSSTQFLSGIESNSMTLPVLVLDTLDRIITFGNIDSNSISDSLTRLDLIQKFKQNNAPLSIDLGAGNIHKIYYLNSPLVAQLRWAPVFLFGTLAIMAFLVIVSYKNIRNHEKNLIWVGMSKETAHQLGTPLSSLSGWLEVLKDSLSSDSPSYQVALEMENDIDRLSLVADRFGKIGSKPKLIKESINDVLFSMKSYFDTRSSEKIVINFHPSQTTVYAAISKSLLDWVLENLIRNAIDSLGDSGQIDLFCIEEESIVAIEVADNGKGITPELIEKIFEPGFTTKKRGWGLGLSLCKRIIEEYFNGKIYVKYSIPNIDTRFRIEIKKLP